MNDEEHARQVWATVFGRMSDKELSTRLAELREMVQIVGLQLRDVNENIEAVIVEQSRRQNRTN